MIAPPIHSRRPAGERDSNAVSLSCTSLSATKARAPTEVEALAEGSGMPPIVDIVQTSRTGWDVTKRAHPAKETLAYSEPPRNTNPVQPLRIDDESIVRVGSRYTFYPKKNGPLDVTRYGNKTPDEYDEKDNPGNEQLLDAATGAASRSQAPARAVNLSRSIQDLFVMARVQWLPLVNAKGLRLLWGKLNDIRKLY